MKLQLLVTHAAVIRSGVHEGKADAAMSVEVAQPQS